ncbi:MAG: serine/threonine protein kinase [Gemmatimonadaceae bacterium]|nr:serine/threonine protein kinase [Gemmatimonadaceae bacterium]
MREPGNGRTAELAGALSKRYTVERELGRGGMGIVYLARDVTLDRPVALKVLPAEFAENPDVRERFLREARTAAHLSHPNIVPIYHADEIDGHAFFAMAFVEGESLAQRLSARGPLPPDEAVRYLREVAWALAYAHARGVIHRDVKPENILIERGSGRALVTDFGIARDVRQQGLTVTGNVLGTVHYMSPEQAAGDFLDGRSDLYALGVVGYYILSGMFPFDSDSASAILVAHVTRDAPPLSSVAPSVPEGLAAVIDRSLAKDPIDRYPAGEDLAEALDDALAASKSERVAKEGSADVVLSERQAGLLWRRAAQLQADALQRLDASRITPSLTSTASAEQRTVGLPTEGYRLRHVQAAAVEAGISEQFVALALAELPSEKSGELSRLESATWQERRAAQLLGTQERSCAATRIIAALPHRVLQALGLALQQSPWELTLKDPVGGHPLDGGVLVFDLPGRALGMGMTYDMSYTWLGLRHSLEAKQVQVTLRAAPGAPSSTEVTMYADLRPGVRRNVNAASWWAGGSGVLGGVIGAGFGAKLLAGIAVVTIGLPALGVGAAAAIAAFAGYRVAYRSAVERAREEMGRALDAVAASVRSQSLLGTAAPVRRPVLPRGAGDDLTIIA